MILPYDERAEDTVAVIDGLLVTDRGFDLPPDWYGGQPDQGDPIDESRPRSSILSEAAAAPTLGP